MLSVHAPNLEATGNQWLKDVKQIDLFIQNELLKDIIDKRSQSSK